RLTGAYSRSDGWQDRTERDDARGSLAFGFGLGAGHMVLHPTAYRDHQDWGSPLPYDAGALVPGFVIDRNYAVRGAKVEHEVVAASSRLTWPVGSEHRIENTLGVTVDRQDYLRSFPGELSGDPLESEGLELEPKETSLYEDVRLVAKFQGAGSHEFLAGAAVTLGETKGEGREFSFDQLLSAYPDIPDADEIPSV